MLVFKPKVFAGDLFIAFLFLALGFFQRLYALNIDKIKVYFLNGDYRGAIAEGERLIAKDEYSSELHYFLGLSYLKEKEYQRSADHFKIVVNNFKDGKFKEEAKIGLADTYLLREDFSNARKFYREIIDENHKSKFKELISSRLSEIESLQANGLQCDVSGPYYSVQVGSFSSIDNARNFTHKLIAQGYSAYMEGNYSAYRVKVGKFKMRSQAEKLSR